MQKFSGVIYENFKGFCSFKNFLLGISGISGGHPKYKHQIELSPFIFGILNGYNIIHIYNILQTTFFYKNILDLDSRSKKLRQKIYK